MSPDPNSWLDADAAPLLDLVLRVLIWPGVPLACVVIALIFL